MNEVVKISFKDLGPKQSVYSYSRELLKEGYSEDTRLEVYRDLALEFDIAVNHIGTAAKYVLVESARDGFVFKKWEPFIPFKTLRDNQHVPSPIDLNAKE